MCFAPQRRALFRDLNLQKSRERGFLYILTSKCASRHNGVHFFDISTSKSGPKLVCVLYILTSKCASRHNGVHFFNISTSQRWSEPLSFLTHLTSKCASRHNGVQLFISHLPRCLRTRRFSEPTFQPSGATKPRKNTVFRDFPTFSRTCIFFPSDLFSSDSYPCWLLFHLSILSEVWLPNFLR